MVQFKIGIKWYYSSHAKFIMLMDWVANGFMLAQLEISESRNRLSTCYYKYLA